MALLRCDFIGLSYADLETARRWWVQVFDCKQVKVPENWDCPLPSDVALKLPGLDEPTILLSNEAEVRQAGYDRPNGHSIIYCSKLPKAHDHLKAMAANPGAIENSGGTQFFNLSDPEGNMIEICKEP
jgi:catechol 2,3-dioxygenase-like lactoylglutathione lyase family enzyme